MRNCGMRMRRRDLLALPGLAAGSMAASGAGPAVPARKAPALPVSVAKVAGYDVDMLAQVERMLDQIGGIGQQVRGKTVAIKVNLTGSSGRGRRVGLSAGQTS